MIIQAFLRWVETAKASERASAASALGRAFAEADVNGIDRQAVEMAMTFLLDDPSPKVRRSLAEALADCPIVPRSIIKALAQDQPEIAYIAISRSPVLNDDDLVDMAADGGAETRALIASRSAVSCAVAAAIAEIGGEEEVLILLENPGARLSPGSLRRIADRLGDSVAARGLLLERHDLPSDARQTLAEKAGAALAASDLVRAVIGEDRAQRVVRETCDAAALTLSSASAREELQRMVAALRKTGRLTPALLLTALCSGRTEFFSAAIVDLSGVPEKRVRSILSGGRFHSIRALLETAGLGREVSGMFSEAVLFCQCEADADHDGASLSVAARLSDRLRRRSLGAYHAVAELAERLAFAEQRQRARNYALMLSRQAA
ncbi:DUF2336 domain-containing protein [Sinorhizobium meliloti]|uniref:DUF2336 domain-containing protein n=1 Tax=Rhizobium meliloti TaxID=382 RepID=UPI001310BA3B|nr:DUF2336 domain-containing protein [Sinorhizobium meliloti]MDX0190200.1 DUF2336 domain-containing protein [Sinorhizobium meliloti]MQV11446.1 DUF2336 domain-containing protein [Sinorhizobium meliloti]MQV58424.1 DUF2336 domain-containing protein [Sinorhizobium meliloti]